MLRSSKSCVTIQAAGTLLLLAMAASCESNPTLSPSPAPGEAANAEPLRRNGAQLDEVPPTQSRRVQLHDELVVFPDLGVVEIGGMSCLDAGWLEQIACSPGTREHESLVVIQVAPSAIHAALMMAGFAPGAPGSWEYDEENNRMTATPPTGDIVAIDVQWTSESDQLQRAPVQTWMRQGNPDLPPPKAEWVFAGSQIVVDSTSGQEQEFYLADKSGSIIGLVTFSDEVLAYRQVISDQVSVREATGEPTMLVNDSVAPPVGTPVTIILHRPEEKGISEPRR